MKKTLKKILALVLSISIVISSVIALGLTASAASVEYYTDSNGIKTGVKRVTLDDGTVYYDIADGKNYLDSDEIRFYKEVLTKKENGVSPADAWANVAAHIIEDAGRGVAYPIMFEDYDYLNGKEDKSVVLSSALAGDKPIDTGFFYSEGMKYYNSLGAVQEEMASYHVDNALVNDDKVDTLWFLKTVTGAETGFDFKESAENSRVFATVIKSRYSTTALAFYDFQLTPVVEENLEYKTAAEGYDDISDAQAAGVPGVTYTSHPTAPAYISYTTNPTRNAANSSVSFTQTSSATISNTMQSTETNTYAHNVGSSVNVTVGKQFPVIGLKAAVTAGVSYGFSTSETISTAYGETNSLTESISNTSNAQITLPPHTKIGLSQQEQETEIHLDYDCPVKVTYKTAVISMWSGTILDKDNPGSMQGMYCGGFATAFESESGKSGSDACASLYERAIDKADITGFDESTFYVVSNNFEDNPTKKGVAWNSIIDKTQTNASNSLRYYVDHLNKYMPISVAGATLSLSQKGNTTTMTEITPLYNLKFVTAGGTTAYSLAKGGSIDLLDISTQGFNQYGVPYHGYLPIKGSWSVCDSNGNPVTNETGITLERPTYTQILTANEIGDYYVRFNIDEKAYTDVDDETKYITNKDLSAFPIVKICVTNTGENHNCVAGEWVTTIPATCFMEGAQVKNCLTCGIQMETRTLEKTAHTNMVITTPATCTEKGSVVTSCGVCGAAISSEETEATGHDDGIWKVDFEATAEHDGQMSRYCTKCGAVVETNAIKLHTHEKGYEKIIIPATCTENGEKGIFCKICDAMYKSEQIEKSGHGETVAVISVQPTCTDAGENNLYCKECGMVVGTQGIPAKGHTEGVWIKSVEPDCTNAGEEICICTDCETVIDVRAVEAFGHDDGVWKVDFEATADHNGQMSKYCSKCNEVLETKEITLHAHTLGYEEVIRPATCIVDGLKGKFCSACGVCYETEAISATGHGETIGLITIQPTCTGDGENVTYCIDCGMKIAVSSISATDHDEGVWKIDFEATADHKGQMSKYCTKCNEILESKEFEKHEHTEGYVKTTPATCTVEGEKAVFCEICGALYKTEVISEKGHGETFAVTTLKATCTEKGEKTLYCSDCGEAVGTEETEALGHSGETYVVSAKPTCTQAGEEILYCDACSEIIGKKEIAATGHSAQWLTIEEATCTKYGKEENTCTVCGAVLETRRIEKEEHVPGKWEITQPSSCTQSGLM
ncbi:MAG: hypothetical protein IJ264_05150, partial [Clostridia bacterium]|nr:hypothetical protein [Clostridia bacterium]